MWAIWGKSFSGIFLRGDTLIDCLSLSKKYTNLKPKNSEVAGMLEDYNWSIRDKTPKGEKSHINLRAKVSIFLSTKKMRYFHKLTYMHLYPYRVYSLNDIKGIVQQFTQQLCLILPISIYFYLLYKMCEIWKHVIGKHKVKRNMKGTALYILFKKLVALIVSSFLVMHPFSHSNSFFSEICINHSQHNPSDTHQPEIATYNYH
jgi:hypothetical protein